MAKKKSDSTKTASKLAKKDKQVTKAAKNELKSIKGKGKAGAGGGGEEDLEDILEKFQNDWKAAHTVTESLQSGPPTRRVNASFTAYGDHLYLIGGEYFDGGKAFFYNDTFRYTPEKNEWRLYTCPTAPAPRSAHASVVIGKDGGQIWIFGGEYASPTQTAFHHYKDLWVFALKDHTWEKVETKGGPSARSGHRMAVWKQYIVLFGGFHDLGIKTNYLSDLWLFDTETYKWKQVEIRDTDRVPGPRSGFSMVASPEGIVVHGGYRKEYTKGSKPKGVALDDTWFLHMNTEPSALKWERKKKAGYAPSTRSGCSMTLWANKGMGVVFGGVCDVEEGEEDIESVFYNDLYAYNLGTNRWSSLNIQVKKKKGGGGGKRKPKVVLPVVKDEDESMEVDEKSDDGSDEDEDEGETKPQSAKEDDAMEVDLPEEMAKMEVDEEKVPDPSKPVLPLTRYNAMIAILKNTLYLYGGIFETKDREYTLADFYILNLEKRDGYVTLQESGIDEEAWLGSDDEDDGDDDDDDDESSDDEDGEEEVLELIEAAEDEEEAEEDGHAKMTQVEKDALRAKAKLFLGSTKETTRSPEEVISTPLPGETLRMFYERSRQFWAASAHEFSSNRGKSLRREGFILCEAKYAEYKPILQEIERIQAEAEVQLEEGKKTAGKMSDGNRNRR